MGYAKSPTLIIPDEFKIYCEGTEEEFELIKDKIAGAEGCAVIYEFSYSYSASDFK